MPMERNESEEHAAEYDACLEWLRDRVLRLSANIAATEWFGMLQKKESKISIEKFLTQSSCTVLVFETCEAVKGVRAMTTIPNVYSDLTSEGGLVYFLKRPKLGNKLAKTGKKIISKEDLAEGVIVGSMPIFTSTRGKLAFLSQVQSLVETAYAIPRGSFLQKSYGWPDVIVEETSRILANFHSDLDTFRQQLSGEILMPTPTLPLKNEGKNKAALIHDYEQLLTVWWGKIDDIIEKNRDISMTVEPLHSTAPYSALTLIELDKWKRQEYQIRSVYEQLNQPCVTHMMVFLEEYGSSTAFVQAHKLRMGSLESALMEATEIYKFLEPMRAPLNRLWEICKKNSVDAVPQIPWILRCLSNIWKLSHFFSTVDRFEHFFKVFSADLIYHLSNHINVEKILKMDSIEKQRNPLFDAVKVCRLYKKLYRREAERLVSCSPDSNWETLDTKSLFSLLDSFEERCLDVQYIVETNAKFSPLSSREVFGKDVVAISNNLNTAKLQYKNIIKELMAVTQGGSAILRGRDKTFEKHFERYRTGIKDLELRLADIVRLIFETAYENSESTESNTVERSETSLKISCVFKIIKVLNILGEFETFFDCRSVNAVWEQQFTNIVRSVHSEVTAILRDFKCRRIKPHISENMPPFAGAIMWTHSIARRANVAVEKLEENCPAKLSGMVDMVALKSDVQIIKEVTDTYIAEKYSDFCTWIDNMEDGVNLKGTLLRRVNVFQGMNAETEGNLSSFVAAFDSINTSGQVGITIQELRECICRVGLNTVDDGELRDLITKHLSGKEVYMKEDLVCLWDQGNFDVRLAFQKFDEDRSGFIDHDEFSHLLRSMGVVFTATQFEQALSQLDPNNDGIDFEEFLAWWADFISESAGKLLAVNIDPKFVQLLKEIQYFKSLNMSIPPEAERLVLWESSFRSHKAHLEFIVTMYNGIHVTLLSVERPLLKDRMLPIEVMIEKATTLVTWEPGTEGVDTSRHDRSLKEFLSATLVQISDFATKLQKLKNNLKKMENAISKWTRQPLIYHSSTETQSMDIKLKILSIDERLNDLKSEDETLHVYFEEAKAHLGKSIEKQKPVPPRESRSRISKEVAGSTGRKLRFRSVGPADIVILQEENSWQNYVDFWNDSLYRGLKNMVKKAMLFLIHRMGYSESGKTLEEDTPNKLFEVSLVFFGASQNTGFISALNQEPGVGFFPSLQEETEKITDMEEFHNVPFQSQVGALLDSLLNIGKCFVQFNSGSKEYTYYYRLCVDDDILSLRNTIVKCLQNSVKQAREYRNQNFLPFLTYWTIDKTNFLKEFVKKPNSIAMEFPLVIDLLDECVPEFAKQLFQNHLDAFWIEHEANNTFFQAKSDNRNERGWLTKLPDLNEFEKVLAKHVESGNSITQLDAEVDHGCLRLQVQSAQAAVHELIQGWSESFVKWIEQFLVHRLQDLLTFMAMISFGLTRIPQSWTPGEYERAELGLASGYASAAKKFSDKFDVILGPLYDMNDLLDKFSEHGLQSNWKKILKNIPSTWSGVTDGILSLQANMSKVESLERDRLFLRQQNFQKKMKSFQYSLKTELPLTSSANTNEAFGIISSFQADYDDLANDVHDLRTEELMFELDPTDLTHLKGFAKDIAASKNMWDLIDSCNSEISTWGQTRWDAIDGAWHCLIETQISSLKQNFSTLPAKFQASDAVIETFKRLDDAQKTIVLILEMKHFSMRDRHFQAIQEIAGLSSFSAYAICSGGASFHDMLSTRIIKFSSHIREVISSAIRQFSVERALQNLDKTWTKTVLKFVKHPASSQLILEFNEDELELLEDHRIMLQNILHSKETGPFIDSLLMWKRRLQEVDNFISTIKRLQSVWKGVFKLFGNDGSMSDLLKKSIPGVWKKFATCNTAFRHLLKNMYQWSTILDVCAGDFGRNVGSQLTSLNDSLNECRASVAKYVKTRRSIFPRFYFLDEYSILEFVASSHAIEQCQTYFNLIFQGVHRVQVKESSTLPTITGVRSMDEEKLVFVNECVCDELAEIWLTKLENIIRHSVKDSIMHSLINSHSALKLPRGMWILQNSSQSITVAARISFTMSIIHCFKVRDSTGVNLNKHLCVVSNNLNETIMLIRSQLTTSNKFKCSKLITIDIHHRDIVNHLLAAHRDGELDECSYEWHKSFRVEWDSTSDAVVQTDGTVSCPTQFATGEIVGKCMNFKSSYMYEYTGSRDVIVITPLTDRCALSLLSAAMTQDGISYLYGKPSTGKYSTLRYIAMTLGRPSRFLPCSVLKNGGVDILADFVQGMMETGAWICCYHIDNLSQNVQMIVIQMLGNILRALRQSDKTLDILGRQVQMSTRSGSITVTALKCVQTPMPQSTGNIFRKIHMSNPSAAKIFTVLLMVEGFCDYERLGRHLCTLYNMLEHTCTNQFKFSMHDLRSFHKGIISGGIMRKSSSLSENHCLADSLYNVLAYRVPVSQRDFLFESIELSFELSACFEKESSKIKESNKIERLKHEIKSAVYAAGLHCDADLILGILHFRELMHQYSSIIIVGESKVGKSSLWSTLSQLNDAQGIETVSVIIPTKAISPEQLYGSFNTSSNLWRDGVFSAQLKLFEKSPGKAPKWIVLDGNIDQSWEHAMESMLRHNHPLTLQTKEEIHLPETVKLIFEGTTLRNASPSLISTCGIFYKEDSTTLWRSSFKTWLKSVASEETETYRVIDNLGEKYFSALNQQLRDKHGALSASKLMINRSFLTTVDMTLAMFESLIKASIFASGMRQTEPPSENTIEETSSVIAEAIFTHAIVWSLGSIFSPQYWSVFDSWLKDFQLAHCSDNFETTARYPSSGTCFDWVPVVRCDNVGSAEEVHYENWENLAMRSSDFAFDHVNEVFAVDQPVLHHLCMPCKQSYRTLYLMKHYVEVDKPVALFGPPGSGKTVLVNTLFKSNIDIDSKHSNNFQIVPVRVAVDYLTTTGHVRDILNPVLDQKAFRAFGGKPGEAVYLFLDDVNNQCEDAYHNRSIISMLRHLVSTGEMFHDDSFSMVNVEGLKYFVTLKPSTIMGNTESAVNTGRCLDHFALISHQEFIESDIMTIFSKILGSHFSNSFSSIRKGSTLIASDDTIESSSIAVSERFLSTISILHFKIRSTFQDRSNGFQHCFNLKHVLSIIWSLIRIDLEYISSPTMFLRIWMHETTRVYGDMLNNDRDHAKLVEMMHHECEMGILCAPSNSNCELEFDDENSILAFQAKDGEELIGALWGISYFPSLKRLIFSTSMFIFEDGRYREVSCGVVREKLSEVIRKARLHDSQIAVVDQIASLNLFDGFLFEFVKLYRLLSFPHLHAHIIDPGGYGDASLAYLACLAHGTYILELDGLKLCESDGVEELIEICTLMLIRSEPISVVVRSFDGKISQGSAFIIQLMDGFLHERMFGNKLENLVNKFKSYCLRNNSVFTGHVDMIKSLNEMSKHRTRFIFCTSAGHTIENGTDSVFPWLHTLTSVVYVKPWSKDDFQHIINEILDENVSLSAAFDDKVEVHRVLECYLEEMDEWYHNDLDSAMKVANTIERKYLDVHDADNVEEESLKFAMQEALADIHIAMMKERGDFSRQVCPATIIIAARVLKKLLSERRAYIVEDLEHVLKARCKFHFATGLIVHLKEDYTVAVERCRNATDEFNKKRESFFECSSRHEHLRKRLKEDEEKCELCKAKITKLKQEIVTAWEIAQPIQLEAIVLIERIPKKDLTELKSFKNPHKTVLAVMQVVVLLFNEIHMNLDPGVREIPVVDSCDHPTLGWKICQKAMINLTVFMKHLKSFNQVIDENQICVKNFSSIGKYLNLHYFNEKSIKQKSKAAHAIYGWLMLIQKYWDAHMTHQPLRNHLEILVDELNRCEAELVFLNKEIDDAYAEAREAEEIFQESIVARDHAEEDRAKLEAQLNCTEEIRRIFLPFQQDLEDRTVGIRDVEFRFMCGEAVFAACLSVYGASLDKSKRDHFFENFLVPHLSTLGIPVRPKQRDCILRQDKAKKVLGRTLLDLVVPYDSYIAQNFSICKEMIKHTIVCVVDDCNVAMDFLCLAHGIDTATTWHEHDADKTMNEINILRSCEVGRQVIVRVKTKMLPPLLEKLIVALVPLREIALREILYNNTRVCIHRNFKLLLIIPNLHYPFKNILRPRLAIISLNFSEASLTGYFLKKFGCKDRRLREEELGETNASLHEREESLMDVKKTLIETLANAHGDWMIDGSVLPIVEINSSFLVTVTRELANLEKVALRLIAERKEYEHVSRRCVDIFLVHKSHKTDTCLSDFCKKLFSAEIGSAFREASVFERELQLKQEADILTKNFLKIFGEDLLCHEKLAFVLAVYYNLLCRSQANPPPVTLVEYLKAPIFSIHRQPLLQTDISPVEWLSAYQWAIVQHLDSLQYTPDSAEYIPALEMGSLAESIMEDSTLWREWYLSPRPEQRKFPKAWKSSPGIQTLCIVKALRPDRLLHAVSILLKGSELLRDFVPLDYAVLADGSRSSAVHRLRYSQLSRKYPTLYETAKTRSSREKNAQKMAEKFSFLAWLHINISHRKAYSSCGWSDDYKVSDYDYFVASKIVLEYGKSRESGHIVYQLVYGSAIGNKRDRVLLKHLIQRFFEGEDANPTVDCVVDLGPSLSLETNLQNAECMLKYFSSMNTFTMQFETRPVDQGNSLGDGEIVSQLIDSFPRPIKYLDQDSISFHQPHHQPYIYSYIYEKSHFVRLVEEIHWKLKMLELITQGRACGTRDQKQTLRNLIQSQAPREWSNGLSMKQTVSLQQFMLQIENITKYHSQWVDDLLRGHPLTALVPLNLFLSKQGLLVSFHQARALAARRSPSAIKIVATPQILALNAASCREGEDDLFVVGGRLEGAAWDFGVNTFTTTFSAPTIQQDLPTVCFSILPVENDNPVGSAARQNVFFCPLYGDRARQNYLCSMHVTTMVDYTAWVERGVAGVFDHQVIS